MKVNLKAILVCYVVAATFAVPVEAIDQRKVAVALAQRAAQAFESGDMVKAAQGYTDAYRNDPAEPNYLYGAARAEQSAHLYEKAETHFRAYMTLPNADAGRLAKARGYLAEVLGARADQKADEATAAAARGDRVLAASAYLDAWRLTPNRHALLFKAALLEREIGGVSMASAIGHLREFLHVAAPDAPERATAMAVLKTLEETGGHAPEQQSAVVTKPMPAAIVDQPHVEMTRTSEPGTSTRTAGWWTLGSGAAVFIVGGAVGLAALSDAATLKRQVTYDATGAHSALSQDAVKSQAARIGAQETAGLVMTCVGVAASGVGVWLITRSANDDRKVALVPSGNGVLLTGRF